MCDIAEQRQHRVPDERPEESVEHELPEVHFRQTRGDTDELTNARDESPDEGAHLAVVVEVVLRFLHFLTAEQEQVPHAAVGELIDNRSPEPHR